MGLGWRLGSVGVAIGWRWSCVGVALGWRLGGVWVALGWRWGGVRSTCYIVFYDSADGYERSYPLQKSIMNIYVLYE